MSIAGRPLRERIGRDDQLGGITPLRLENGVRAARIRTLGGIDALVILDRAMDVAHCSFLGVPLVWHGPGGILPAHPGTLSDDEFERRFFGGLLTTCGLGAFGPAGSDAFGSWGQHGHVNHIAADEITVRTILDAPEPFMELAGVVTEAHMFGESLRLERTWRAALTGTTLSLHDVVINEGATAVPHMLLYHCNAGYPLLDETAEVFVSQSSMRPRDENARAGLQDWNRGGLPAAGFKEQVFVHTPAADTGGWAAAGVRNASLQRAFTVQYRPEELPVCFSWRMLAPRTYVMAIEPANCPTVEGRIAAREAGTLPMLQPGESVEYHLRFTFSLG